MSYWVDPRGKSTYGIGLCGRCSRKMSLTDLYPDPNAPGLMVCKDDLDDLDPYRLPARQTERINLPFVRPDVPLTGFGPANNLLSYNWATEDDSFFGTEDGNYFQVES
jgi:hypothetical protein